MFLSIMLLSLFFLSMFFLFRVSCVLCTNAPGSLRRGLFFKLSKNDYRNSRPTIRKVFGRKSP